MYVPRWYQNEAVDSVFDYFNRGMTGHPVIAMPTATGKSLVIAELLKKVFQLYPNQRAMMLTHVKELIEQNADKITQQWPGCPIGIYSSGLRSRDIFQPIIYGGVGSVIGCVDKFGHRDLLVVDEAHRISPKEDSEYKAIIKALMKINPYLKVIGLTATPYRLGQGLITDGGLFTDICYDLCTLDKFNRLIDEGYLALLIPKQTNTALDVSGVKIVRGDFSQTELAAAVDKDKVTWAACNEMAQEGYDRRSWLIFASSIQHAENISRMMQALGVNIVPLHSKMKQAEQDKRIENFRNFKVRGIANYGKLTTGFDHPAIDFIGHLRPTMSTGLWVQTLGRGMRPYLGKDNCLVLDFARNTLRLGPINDPVIPRKRKKGDQPGVAPIRICLVCGVYNHARATHCIACGAEFPKTQKLVTSASTDELLRRSVKPIVATMQVNHVTYGRHQTPGSPPSIHVTYYCGLRAYSKYICLEHTGAAAKIAREWWIRAMGSKEPPPSTDDALKVIQFLKKPRSINVWTNKGKYPEIMGIDY